MARYRTDSVVVDAEQFWPDDPRSEWPAAITSHYTTYFVKGPVGGQIDSGDWVLTDSEGLHHRCEASLFYALFGSIPVSEP